jgi:hypothetical protein
MIVYCNTDLPNILLAKGISFKLNYKETIKIIYTKDSIIHIIDDTPFQIKENNHKVVTINNFIFDYTEYQQHPILSQLPTHFSFESVNVYQSPIPQLNGTLFLHKIKDKPDLYFFETENNHKQFLNIIPFIE